MGDFLSRVCHDRVRVVDELIEAKFVEEPVSLFSVSVKDGWFFSLEGVFVSLDQVQWWWKGSR